MQLATLALTASFLSPQPSGSVEDDNPAECMDQIPKDFLAAEEALPSCPRRSTVQS